MMLAAAALTAMAGATSAGSQRCEAAVRLEGPEKLPMLVPVGSVGSAASAYFEDTLLTTGWGVFEVFTEPTAPDEDQAFSAGYLEGFLTGAQTAKNYANMWSYFFTAEAGNLSSRGDLVTDRPGPFPATYHAWFDEQYRWAKGQAGGRDPFWRQAGLVLRQFDGQVAGLRDYFAGAPHPCESASLAEESQLLVGNADPWEVATLLNSVGDLLDVQASLNEAKTAPYDPSLLKNWMFERSLCTAIFKVLPDFSDVLMGHTSWFTFSATNRIYKHYHIHTMPEHTAASSMSFSSYAGFQNSLDDFYLLSSGLIMIQTSIGVLDPDLHRQAKPRALLAWQRVRIAHALSHSGQEWHQNLARENSGTYNNEYMIFDTNKFVPGEPLQPNLFWVVEQIPGLVEGRDMTNILEYGYFPSFNVPVFENVWTKAGYRARFEATKNAGLTHAMAARAQIFRRDHSIVTDLEGVTRLLQSNDFEHDPLSNGDPIETICARGDLQQQGSKAFGCYDVKATRVGLARNLTAVARSGPTRGTGNRLPQFQWKDFNSTAHVGLPDSYDFPFRTMRPQWLQGPVQALNLRASPGSWAWDPAAMPKAFI